MMLCRYLLQYFEGSGQTVIIKKNKGLPDEVVLVFVVASQGDENSLA